MPFIALLILAAMAPLDTVDQPGAQYHSENGFLVAYADTELALSDRTERQLYSVTLQHPDGPLVRIEDVAVARDGSVAVAGKWSETNYGFVLTGPEGNLSAAADTYPFHPTAITIGPDGYIWLHGLTGEKASLRRYSPRGVLLSDWPSPEPHARLFSSNTRAALLTEQSREWIEFDSEGKVTRRTPVPAMCGDFVLNDANELFLFSGKLHRMDFGADRWIDTEDSPSNGEDLTLAGEDGPYLIFVSKSLGLRKVLRIAH